MSELMYASTEWEPGPGIELGSHKAGRRQLDPTTRSLAEEITAFVDMKNVRHAASISPTDGVLGFFIFICTK